MIMEYHKTSSRTYAAIAYGKHTQFENVKASSNPGTHAPHWAQKQTKFTHRTPSKKIKHIESQRDQLASKERRCAAKPKNLLQWIDPISSEATVSGSVTLVCQRPTLFGDALYKLMTSKLPRLIPRARSHTATTRGPTETV